MKSILQESGELLKCTGILLLLSNLFEMNIPVTVFAIHN